MFDGTTNARLNFSDFDLHPDLLDGIDALNYTAPTPIQAQAIPLILEGKDLIGTAQTGTGKTAAFVLPILNLILDSGEANYVQALVVVPTRELAMQIDQVVEAYSYFTGVSSIAIYGGSDGKAFDREKTAITKGVDIVIATPGRLLAHMQLGYVNFSRLRFLVLDEADRMLDMGFQPDLLRIIETINPKRQTLLFSATMPPPVMKFAKTLLRDPEMVKISISKPAEGVTQHAYIVPEHHKLGLMTELLRDKTGQRIIVFCSSKLSVSSLFRSLRARKIAVEQVSSDLEQAEREQVMQDFRNRKVDILVATDVLSRGIDVDGIDAVFNYDVPREPEDYVHRIGRTARAERKGAAVTLVSPLDFKRFKRIEQLIGREVEKLPLPEQFAKEAPAPRASDHRRDERSRGPKGGNERPKSQEKRRPERPKIAQPETALAQRPAAEGENLEQKTASQRRRRRGGRNRKPKTGGENNTPPAGD